MNVFGRRQSPPPSSDDKSTALPVFDQVNPAFVASVLTSRFPAADEREALIHTVLRKVSRDFATPMRYLGTATDFYALRYRKLAEASASKRGDVVAATPDADQLQSYVVEIGSESFRIFFCAAPMVHTPVPGPLPLRSFDPTQALSIHKGQIVVTSSKHHGSVKDRKHQALGVQLLATLIAIEIFGDAIYWQACDGFMNLDQAAQAMKLARAHKLPVPMWVQLYPIARDDPHFIEHMLCGCMTLGLAAFIDREVELAPSSRDLATAVAETTSIISNLADLSYPIKDYGTMPSGTDEPDLTMRLVHHWQRPMVPALVLVARNSVVDFDTLSAKAS